MTIVYDVYTDLDPDQLTAVAMETYRIWLQFALGQSNLTGKKLMNPSGRYAAALSWSRSGPNRVTILADESVAPEAAWIEAGTAGADVKQMLDRNTKYTKDGHPYRVIPLRPDVAAGPLTFNFDTIAGTSSGKGERMPKSQSKIWAVAREVVDPNSRFRTMTDNPTPGWQIHPMPAYAPGLILKSMLENQYGRR
jgi:hypothetical protein